MRNLLLALLLPPPGARASVLGSGPIENIAADAAYYANALLGSNPPFFIFAGPNLEYKPWGLSFSLTGPIAKKAVEALSDVQVTQWTVSKSFGNYRRERKED